MKKLILLSLPLGNLEDITQRVKSALEKGKYFIAEDTRNLKKLMNLYGIELAEKKILSFHDQSQEGEEEDLLTKGPNEVYLCSDAGSPIISDPAYPVVKKAIELGYEVDSYTGPSSVILALELSGLPATPFHFYGFYPREKKAQEELQDLLSRQQGSHVFFESPHRIKKTLKDLGAKFPDLIFSVCREMSKKFQAVYRYRGSEFDEMFKNMTIQGEFVFILYQENKHEGLPQKIIASAQEVLDSGAHPKKVAQLLSDILKDSPKSYYQKLNRKD